MDLSEARHLLCVAACLALALLGVSGVVLAQALQAASLHQRRRATSLVQLAAQLGVGLLLRHEIGGEGGRRGERAGGRPAEALVPLLKQLLGGAVQGRRAGVRAPEKTKRGRSSQREVVWGGARGGVCVCA